jgi:hypothetical protein
MATRHFLFARIVVCFSWHVSVALPPNTNNYGPIMGASDMNSAVLKPTLASAHWNMQMLLMGLFFLCFAQLVTST